MNNLRVFFRYASTTVMYKYTISFRIYGHNFSCREHVQKKYTQTSIFFGIDYVANEGCHVINPFPFPLAIPSLYCTCSINDYFDLQIYPKFKMMKLEMAQRL